jgi:hypothetical protein
MNHSQPTPITNPSPTHAVTSAQSHFFLVLLPHLQASLIAEELLRHNPEVVRIVYNKFRSAISFKPTLATVLMPEVSAGWMAGPPAAVVRRGRSVGV